MQFWEAIQAWKVLENRLLQSYDVLLKKFNDLTHRYNKLSGAHSDLLARFKAMEEAQKASEAEKAELRSRLNRDSGNSNQPPSMDGLSKKTRAERTPGIPKDAPKRNGGKTGHEGKTLQMVEVPDVLVVHPPFSCVCCGKVFSPGDVVATEHKRQVIDIPGPCYEVTEHRRGMAACCGQQHFGTFPPEVAAPVQYGARVCSFVVLMANAYNASLANTCRAISDLWGLPFNESTAITANKRMYDALGPVEKQIGESILASGVAHFDETGMRAAKKLHWFHVASTERFTHLFVHPKRGREALMGGESLLPAFGNLAVHDCWPGYFDFVDCGHALCGAHLLRELAGLSENGSKWAGLMRGFVLGLYKTVQNTRAPVADRETWEAEFGRICQVADEEEPRPEPSRKGRAKSSKGRSLLNRLVKYRDMWLAFAFVENVPFTNNQAERDIRCLKTKQKVATNFQTLKGAEHYARIQAFTSTLRKHSINVFQGMIDVLEGKVIVFEGT